MIERTINVTEVIYPCYRYAYKYRYPQLCGYVDFALVVFSAVLGCIFLILIIGLIIFGICFRKNIRKIIQQEEHQSVQNL